MRVCSPHCGLAPETTSGGETYERELLVRLGEAGVRLDILLARGKPLPENVPNWRIHRLPIGRGLRWYVAPFVLPPAIGRIQRAEGMDVLRAHSARYIGPAALIARSRHRIDAPVIVHHHHVDPGPLARLIDRRVFMACDQIVTVSEFSRRQLSSELGVPESKVVAIHDGVASRFAPEQRDAALVRKLHLAGGPVAMFLGGLKARKNLPFLITVWREVVRRLPSARLLVVGSGPEESAMRRAAREQDVAEQIVFTGRVSEADKVRYYNLADVFVSPSALEGFGLSVAEAMSCGLPVVVARRGALPELVGSGPGAVVCEPDAVSEFTEALVEFCNLPSAASEAPPIGHASRALPLGSARRARSSRRTKRPWPGGAHRREPAAGGTVNPLRAGGSSGGT
jgi:glycosyltransferase involved in cell wall biosynthesis